MPTTNEEVKEAENRARLAEAQAREAEARERAAAAEMREKRINNEPAGD